jgi:hypothetical protein
MELGSSIVGYRKQLYILLSRQRSGSTLLRSFINSHPDMIAFGELFYPDSSPEFMAGYYHYWLQRIASDRSSIILEREPLALLEKYLESLSGIIEFKQSIVVDVKYSQAENIPNFFRFINERGCPVIHLVRGNVLATYISDLVLNQRIATGQSIHGVNKLPSIKVTIDTGGLIKELDQRAYEHQYYLQRTESSKVLEVIYEDCTRSAGEQTVFREDQARRLCEFMSCDYVEMKSSLRKQGDKMLEDMVTNWSEVKEVLSNTKYRALADYDGKVEDKSNICSVGPGSADNDESPANKIRTQRNRKRTGAVATMANEKIARVTPEG